MKCTECNKKIEAGYVLNTDVFCSKKCLYLSVYNYAKLYSKKVTKSEAYEDGDVLAVQKDCFDEDLGWTGAGP